MYKLINLFLKEPEYIKVICIGQFMYKEIIASAKHGKVEITPRRVMVSADIMTCTVKFCY